MLIDVTRLADRKIQGRLPTGVDRVSLAYLEHFSSRASALVRFGGRWIKFPFRTSQLLFNSLIEQDHFSASIIRRIVWRAYFATWKGSDASLLINTGHSGLEHPDFVARVRRENLRPIFFLHDLIPISHPEYCRPGEDVRHRRRLDTMLSVGSGLILNSQATLDDLQAYASERKIAIPPSVVAPLAAAALPFPVDKRPIDKPYFVMLGTIEPRKNHLLLLHLWRQLIAEFGDAAPRLVIIGQRGWECEQIVDLLDRCQALNGIVIEHSHCTDRELVNWLAHAQALLFPSFAEGFGIPLVEALTLGLPVIASNLPVFREIAGDIPEYLDPIDGASWKRMVLDYARLDSSHRGAQRERIAPYTFSTWEQHFALVDTLVSQLEGVASE